MARSSPLVDTRIIYCGDCLDQLARLPNHSIDLIYIDEIPHLFYYWVQGSPLPREA